MQSQSLKPEGFAEVPGNILPEFLPILLEGRENACHQKRNSRQLISDVALLSGKNWLNLELIEVYISIVNKTRPEYMIFSAPALREYSGICINLIEKVKL